MLANSLSINTYAILDKLADYARVTLFASSGHEDGHMSIPSISSIIQAPNCAIFSYKKRLRRATGFLFVCSPSSVVKQRHCGQAAQAVLSLGEYPYHPSFKLAVEYHDLFDSIFYL